MVTSQNFRFCLLLFCMAFLSVGCGAGPISKEKALHIEVYRPVHVEKTGQDKRPDWTTKEPFSEDKKGFYFTGGIMSGGDYVLTIRLAKAEAVKNLLESIEIKVRGEFSSAIQGQNRDSEDLGRYVTDAVAWTVDNLRIGGIRQQEIYYEKIFDPVSQSFKYNSWVKLGISKTDCANAKLDAVQKLLEKTIRERDEAAKEKAMKLLEKLRREV
jgi:hypothetical protein